MNVGQLLGWLFAAASAGCALQMWWLDARMQDHRSPSAPRRAYWLVPFRWQRQLYVGEGPRLVDRAWRAFGRMLLLGAVAMLLLAYAVP
jgi:hypothetical protein